MGRVTTAASPTSKRPPTDRALSPRALVYASIVARARASVEMAAGGSAHGLPRSTHAASAAMGII